MLHRAVVSAVAIAFVCAAGVAAAADPAAGKADVDKSCGACHAPEDWKGKSAAQLETQIKAVSAGKVKHPKKVSLTDAQIADIAAYWAAGAN